MSMSFWSSEATILGSFLHRLFACIGLNGLVRFIRNITITRGFSYCLSSIKSNSFSKFFTVSSFFVFYRRSIWKPPILDSRKTILRRFMFGICSLIHMKKFVRLIISKVLVADFSKLAQNLMQTWYSGSLGMIKTTDTLKVYDFNGL